MSFGNMSPFSGIDASSALNNIIIMGPASATNNGYLLATDWVIFNTKELGLVKTDQTTGQTIGTTGTRLTKLWSSDIDTASLTSSGRITITGGDVTTYGYEALQLPNGISGIDAGLSTRILAGESIIQFGNNYQAHYTGSIDSSKAGAMIRIDTRNGSGASTYGGQAYTLFQIQTRVAGTTTSEIPFQITAAPTGSLIIGTTGLVTFGYGITTPGVITSTLVNGTTPFTIASSTLVSNLNADTVDGYHASSLLQGAAYEILGIACSDETTDLTTGVAFAPRAMPFGFIATRVYGELATAATGNAFLVSVKKAGTLITNAALSIADGAVTGETLVFDGGASSYTFAKGDLLSIIKDQVGSTAAGKGLIIFLEGYRT